MNAGRIRDERGAITVWVLSTLLGFILSIGLGVDFAGHARTEQHARAVAMEAARAGGQHLTLADGKLRLQTAPAKQAAENYVAASEFAGSARIVGGTTVQVHVTGQYHCVFLGLIGVHTLPIQVDGSADAITN